MTSNSDFVFEAGNVDMCIRKIRNIVENPLKLRGYYDDYPTLTTMREHIEDLERFYNGKN